MKTKTKIAATLNYYFVFNSDFFKLVFSSKSGLPVVIQGFLLGQKPCSVNKGLAIFGYISLTRPCCVWERVANAIFPLNCPDRSNEWKYTTIIIQDVTHQPKVPAESLPSTSYLPTNWYLYTASPTLLQYHPLNCPQMLLVEYIIIVDSSSFFHSPARDSGTLKILSCAI